MPATQTPATCRIVNCALAQTAYVTFADGRTVTFQPVNGVWSIVYYGAENGVECEIADLPVTDAAAANAALAAEQKAEQRRDADAKRRLPRLACNMMREHVIEAQERKALRRSVRA